MLSQSSQEVTRASPVSSSLSQPLFSPNSSQPRSQTESDVVVSELSVSRVSMTTVAMDTSVARGNNQTLIEDITPVNKKYLAKALRPPVTIKNFFKPHEKVKTERDTGKEEHSENNSVDRKEDLKNNAEREKGDVVVLEEGCTAVKKEMSYEEFLNAGCDTNKVKKETPVSDFIPGASGSGSGIKAMHGGADKTLSSRKRVLESESCSTQPKKKAKQITLFSTFEKMAAKKSEDAAKAVTCPICQTVFDKGISNSELNKHIDNCVIE